MPRPLLNEDEKRSERFNLRYTLAELETVRSRASKAGLSTMEYQRRCILDQERPPEALQGADPALIAALNNYILTLAPIGNNVNQLAAATHQGRDFVQYWQEIGAELQADLVAARKALDKALEKASK
jgi:hypothetical protein